MKRRKQLQRKTRLATRSRLRTSSKRWGGQRSLQQARKFVRGRAHERCEIETPACTPGWHRGEHAHHVRMRSQGGSDDPGNLLWVCAAGHRWIHDNPAESYRRGYLQRGAA